jgi:hypothetical protein
MSVNIMWDNDKHTAVRMEFIDRWTWDEVHRAMTQHTQMLNETSNTVAGIIDLTDGIGTPPLILTQMRGIMQKRHPRTGMIVLVGANDVVITFWKIFLQAYGRLVREPRYAYAKTVQEARAIIESQAAPTTPV